ELAHAPENAADLTERAVRRLYHADRVVRVALGDDVGANLGLHPLADRESRGVVRRGVDAQAARELLEARLERRRRAREVLLRVQRRNVGDDTEGHGEAPDWYVLLAGPSSAYGRSVRTSRLAKRVP